MIQCYDKDCDNIAIYGYPTKGREACGNHMKEDMLDLVYRYCICGNQSMYGAERGKPVRCARCRSKQDIYCLGYCVCGKEAHYGIYGQKRSCEKCRFDEDLYVESDDRTEDERSEEEQSENEQSEDDDFVVEDSEEDYSEDDDYEEKDDEEDDDEDDDDDEEEDEEDKDDSDGGEDGDIENSEDDKFVSYTIPKKAVSTTKDISRKYDKKRDEVKVRDKIISKFGTPLSFDSQISQDGKKTRKRPDILYKCNQHFIVIETDERCHSNYVDEDIRMVIITKTLNAPCIFIRFNSKGNIQELINSVTESMNTEYRDSNILHVKYIGYPSVKYKEINIQEFIGE